MQVLATRTPAAMAIECESVAQVIGAISDRVSVREASGFHAIDWVYQTYAYDCHDVSATEKFRGNLAMALAAVRAKTLIVSAPNDLYNPTSAATEVASLIPGACYAEIPSIYGHHAANGIDPQDATFLTQLISEFLS